MHKSFDELDRELLSPALSRGISRAPRPLVFREREPRVSTGSRFADALIDMVGNMSEEFREMGTPEGLAAWVARYSAPRRNGLTDAPAQSLPRSARA